jgi:hypothetical protein
VSELLAKVFESGWQGPFEFRGAVEFRRNRTHLDGKVGPQFVAAKGAFDVFAGICGGIDDLMLRCQFLSQPARSQDVTALRQWSDDERDYLDINGARCRFQSPWEYEGEVQISTGLFIRPAALC